MKRLLSFILFLTIGFVSFGQNVHFERGYAWSLGVGAYTGSAFERDNEGFGASLYTEHGFNFGNGLFVGGGFGAIATTDMSFSMFDGIAFPAFAEIRYSFMDKSICPFASFKSGTMLGMHRPFFAPAIGLDFNRFSIQLEYGNYPQHFVVGKMDGSLKWLGFGFRDGGNAASISVAVHF